MKRVRSQTSLLLTMGYAVLFTWSIVSHAEPLSESRQYEPVILEARTQINSDGNDIALFSGFWGASVYELFLYNYDAASDSWSMMPYQIDEQTKGQDPLNPSKERWFYIIPPEWDNQQHDGLFKALDELVFLVGDMGDAAPTESWIPNEESKQNGRLELIATDPFNPESKSYAYLFQSTSIAEAVPTPYEFNYDPALDQVKTAAYTLKHERHGVIEDITINAPGGSGEDILDLLKLRFAGVIDLAIPIDVVLTESNFYLFTDGIYTSPNPVVRLVRRAKQAAELFTIVFEDTPFWLKTHYFPYSGTIETGASIYKKDLEAMFPEADITIIMRYTRQSWDFNENASGMSFYNAYNQAVLIDGNPDNVIKTMDVPVNAWSMLTGTQGSVFTLMQLQETNWDQVELYYFDSAAGGQADSVNFGNLDTGDNQSYGDNGIWLRNIGRDSLTFDLDLTAYFLPQKNMTADEVNGITEMALDPIEVTSARQQFGPSSVSGRNAGPADFELFQNFPNPFNGSTLITFILPSAERIRLSIRDATGRSVRTLTNENLTSGAHRIFWHGKDDAGRPVSSGVYICQIESGANLVSRKLTLTQ